MELIVVNGFKHFIMIPFPWGHRKTRAFLQREGISLSKTTVHKYMNCELQPHSICRRKKLAYHRGLAHNNFPNLLKRNFSPKQLNRVWCTELTYMALTNIQNGIDLIEENTYNVTHSQQKGRIVYVQCNKLIYIFGNRRFGAKTE